ncbi:helix-turn-helix domain-containing protein [Deinococcus fonticola]|uniref:helix-turn-helix domain-containing protein n=1 Tax=Deinococcus fonticola TaxID=2528713 RepID=UPI00143009D3|nr:helix-turn-helix transcriptional regulator [Deinococcus fonticola]
MVGERVKEVRLKQGLSLEQLHDLILEVTQLDISQPTLSRIERQERSVYDFEVAAFARVLKVDAGWLLGLTNE